MTSGLVRLALSAMTALALTTASSFAADPDLRLETVRESLTGTHYRYRQYVDGLPVVGAELVLTKDHLGRVLREERQLVAVPSRRISAQSAGNATHMVNVGGIARAARREVREEEPLRPIAYYYDATTGELLRVEPLFFNAKPARVFEANPVSKLNAPSLRDMNDAASAVPAAAYSDMELHDVNESGPLAGPNARIVDVENPAIAPIDGSRSLLLDRQDDGFEDVNAYYHVDRMQRYLQSLGYTGAKRLVPYAVPVDAHAAGGADNSYYISSIVKGEGTLFFGDGGTDDAEDPDLVVHEYGHAVLDWIAPLAFTGSFGSQARALSEAFSDYIAFSDQYRWNVASGRDASCFADWDARCDGEASSRCAYAPGSDCLRRLDSNKTMADYITRDSSGVEHQNSVIWSSALREIFLALDARHGAAEGKRISDTLVVESMFGLPASPAFADNARRLLFVDSLLFEGTHAPVICAAMSARAILTDCAAGLPRGEWTLSQSSDHGVPIPDVNSAGVVSRVTITDTRAIEDVRVRVDIRHSSRGDLRISLIAPDGTEIVLQELSIDRTADVHATYGWTATAAQSLAILRDRSAAGVWQLRVVDLRPGDVGTLESWGLRLRLAGDVAATTRPASNLRFVFPAGHVIGANGERWLTDVRLFSGAVRAPVTLLYTPGNVDGRTAFGAVSVMVEAEQVVALNDVVATLFGTAGFGQIEIVSPLAIEAISRSYALTARGTLGEAVKPGGATVRARSAPCPLPQKCTGSDSIDIPVLRSDAFNRSNVAVAETEGGRGIVRIELFDAVSGSSVGVRELAIEPHGFVQIAVAGAARMTASVTVISGNAAVRAYASVVDARSSDTSIIAGNAGLGFTPAISAPGANGVWKTDVWVTGTFQQTGGPAIRFHEPGTTTTVPLVLAPHTAVELNDAVAIAFHRPGAFGFVSTLGTFHVSRIYTDTPAGGTVGQTVSASATVFSGPVDLLFADENDAFRTNAGALNPSTEAVTMMVTIFDSSGRAIASSMRTIPSGGVVQFPLSDVTPLPITNGRVQFDAMGRGAIVPWLSRIDRRSGDPTYISPR